jgi:hypothetical protein
MMYKEINKTLAAGIPIAAVAKLLTEAGYSLTYEKSGLSITVPTSMLASESVPCPAFDDDFDDDYAQSMIPDGAAFFDLALSGESKRLYKGCLRKTNTAHYPTALKLLKQARQAAEDTALVYFHDDGHGWLRVTADDLARLNMDESHFSPFSYRRVGNNGVEYFLEEDSDAKKYIEWFVVLTGKLPEIEHQRIHGMAFIRRLNRLGP